MLPEGTPGAGGYREHDILIVGEDGAETSLASPMARSTHRRGQGVRWREGGILLQGLICLAVLAGSISLIALAPDPQHTSSKVLSGSTCGWPFLSAITSCRALRGAAPEPARTAITQDRCPPAAVQEKTMQYSRFLPKGAATVRFDSDAPPKTFHFLLLPKTTMLAFSAAIEPLRIANQLTQKPLFEWYAHSPTGCRSAALTAFRYMWIPGYAIWTAMLRCLSAQEQSPRNPTTAAPSAGSADKSGMASASAASAPALFALAAAGALTGRRFTLHWEKRPGFC